jgi:prevent-host-death family protein
MSGAQITTGAFGLDIVPASPLPCRSYRLPSHNPSIATRLTPHYMLVNLVNSRETAPGAAMTDIVNIYDAKTNLSKLVDRAAAGEEIVIAKAGKPKAKLVPYRSGKKRRGGQNLLGITYIAEDFDAPLPPEIQKYFE